MLFGLAEMRIVSILLESDVLLMTDWILVLFTMKPTPSFVFAAEPNATYSSVVVSQQFYECFRGSNDVQSISIQCIHVSSLYFPHLFKVFTFHVPLVTFSVDSLMRVVSHRMSCGQSPVLICFVTVAL